MNFSIIIPTLNEADNIERLVKHLLKHKKANFFEVIVVDAGSTDNTFQLAHQAGALVVRAPRKGRAAQMNYGAKIAKGEVLYFVHGDSLPPLDYYDNIKNALENGSKVGGFRFKFDSKKPILKVNNYLTHFNIIFVRGGDQTLFITKDFFDELGGYRDDYIIMEEYDLIERAQKFTKFTVIPNDVFVNARKYDNNSWLRVQLSNAVIFAMYRLGFSQHKMAQTYKKLLNYRYE